MSTVIIQGSKWVAKEYGKALVKAAITMAAAKTINSALSCIKKRG